MYDFMIIIWIDTVLDMLFRYKIDAHCSNFQAQNTDK